MYLFIHINMLSLRRILNSTPILLRQTFIRRFFNDKGKSNHSEAEGGDHFQLVIDGVQASLDEHLQGKRKWGLGHL